MTKLCSRLRSCSVACFFLVGCATPLEELTDNAQSCGTGPECKPLWEKVYRREDALEKREQRDIPCPGGMVKYEDWTGVKCISRREMKWILWGH